MLCTRQFLRTKHGCLDRVTRDRNNGSLKFNSLKYLLLFERKSCRVATMERERRERRSSYRPCIDSFSKCLHWLGLDLTEIRGQEFLSSPMQLAGPSAWGVFCCFPRCISKDWLPCGTLASQVAGMPTVPHADPFKLILKFNKILRNIRIKVIWGLNN